MRIPGGSTAGVVLYTPPGHEDRIGTMSHIVFTSGELEKTYHELVERGVEFAQPLKQEPWGMSAIFIDIEGNQFALTSCEATWVMDGRFLRQEYSSIFVGKPLTVVRYLGFDRHKGKFVEV